MKRTQIYLTEKEKKTIKEYSTELGISKSEMIRRIIDLYIDNQKVVN